MTPRSLASLLLAAALACTTRAHAAETTAFVFGTDYTTGSLSAAALGTHTPQCDVASVHSDATLRFWGGQLYVVNRFGGDNVQVIDPATHATVRQFSVGNGANPHDIEFASAHKAYVTRFESSDLWVVDPSTGAHTGTISLAAFADADGIPEMDRLALVDDRLFVSLERLDRNHGYAPSDTAYVAVVDANADTLVDCDPATPGTQAIRLPRHNPFTAFQWDAAGAHLMIGCAGAFGVLDGGIVRIDPARLVADSVLVGEAALGGDVNTIVWGSADTSWAIVATPAGDTQLVAWSATSGTRIATLWSPGGYVLTDAARDDRGGLWVCENSFTTPRVRVFATATGLPLGSDIVCTLPPTAIAFDVADGPAAEPAAPAGGVALSPAAPNPARTTASFAVTLAAPARARCTLLDASGRRVRTLADRVFIAGPATLQWDLADDGGRRVPAGVYWLHVECGGATRTQAVIVLR